MLISFRSKAAADFLMLSEHAQMLLQLMDKPFTPQGIFSAEEIPARLEQLHAALNAHANIKNTENNSDNSPDTAEAADESDADKTIQEIPVGLKQRAWPLLNMLTRAQIKKTDVSWGV